VAGIIRQASLCALGQMATNPALSNMSYFPEEFAEGVERTARISRRAD
jgi:NADH:ubiquinone oxidoreductase subunit F (NADH-binding)